MSELSLLAGLCWGLTALAAAWCLVDFLMTPPAFGPAQSIFERARRQRLREQSALYRWFEPGMDKLAAWNANTPPKRLEKLRRHLQLAPGELPWTPQEYLAYIQLQAALGAVAACILALLAFGSLVGGVVLAVLVGFGLRQLLGTTMPGKVEKRLQQLKKRLPFTIDLMALMMEAGASFQDSLKTAVRDMPGHPLADELGQVLRDVELGRPRAEALVTLQQRLNDDDVSEIVFAVNKGEELGTPLAQILRSQAEQMRLKRSQWAEKAAGIAQVNIVFPGMMIMVACLIIVVAPFVLLAIFSSE
jgi:tight adherence protein C